MGQNSCSCQCVRNCIIWVRPERLNSSYLLYDLGAIHIVRTGSGGGGGTRRPYGEGWGSALSVRTVMARVRPVTKDPYCGTLENNFNFWIVSSVERIFVGIILGCRSAPGEPKSNHTQSRNLRKSVRRTGRGKGLLIAYGGCPGRKEGST